MRDSDTVVLDWSTVDLTPQVCVRRGTVHLDKWFPGWASQIDLSKLDVQDCAHCPLAWATGEDYRTTIEIDQGRDWLVAHGFLWDFRRHSGTTVSATRDQALWGELNTAWRIVVAARQLSGRRT